MSFVHLHVHSEYSLLDGLSRIPALVERARALGMPAIALTDHGTLFGVMDFYQRARAEGVKPILGMEAYLAPRSMADRDPHLDSKSYHLLLLAENDAGYRNLLQIATAAQLQGFYYRPRIDHEFLAQHSQGLLCTTGCLSGEVPRALLEGRTADARRSLDWYFEVFGRDRFFIELQDHAIAELPAVNASLRELAPHYQARLVATNDVHYVEPSEADLQDILLCIQTGALRSDPDRMRMTDSSYYLRTPEEMQSLFADVPEALSNTLWIAERCSVDLEFKGYHLPHFPLPDGRSADAYLRSLCEHGLPRRYPDRAGDPALRSRLETELGIIHQMGFDTYFLIVWDLCRYAREKGIWYNARGSAAGSLVAYCLEITLVDPIGHGLIFERFLNPGRVSMPDIDLDFQDDRRSEMLEYAAAKYGRDRVAQIITFGTLGARAAIRDVGRVLDVPLPEVDRVAKLIPQIPGKPVTLTEVLESVPAFREIYDSAPYLHELIDTASRLEGVVRNAGTHAAGVIITDRPITEYLPLHRPTKGAPEDNPIGAVTQFEMQVLESLGLLKVDFLGLSTLTVMARACAMIRQRTGVDLDIDSIPLDDAATYALLGKGEVLGVFQVEGAGMRRYLMEMKPQHLPHVVAMVALYRPGPMDFIPTYIRRMHGEEPVTFRHESLEPVLGETYGITVYQEQIMYTAMQLAGYSATEADNLRVAVAKKKEKALRQQRDKFVSGAVSHAVPRDSAEAIFDDWEAFARYGFPKGHAADYAVICVETAYLKAHYPLEYMTALLSVFRGDTARVALYSADCRRMGIAILPPDLQRSGLDFEIDLSEPGQTAIRFGLGAVKNVGEGAVAAILDARGKAGEFRGIEDFARRVDLRHVGKRALESLVRVGALDRLGARASLLEALDQILSVSAAHFRAAEIGQLNLFSGSAAPLDTIQLPTTADLPRRQQLAWERELLGVYASDHPLTPHLERLTQIVTHFSAELGEAGSGETVTVGGEVTHIRPYLTRSGKNMAFVTVEDLQGAVELVVFTRVWDRVGPWLQSEHIVVVTGKVDAERGDPKLLVQEIRTLESYPVAAPPPAAEALEASATDTAVPFPAPSAYDGEGGFPFGTQEVVAEVAGGVLAEVRTEVTALVVETETQILPATAPSGRRLVTIILRSTGDKVRDARRMRRVHGLLNSYPGSDPFVFDVYESSRRYSLEFPNSSTGFCAELKAQLEGLLGTGSVRVAPYS
jgi:DNA polymerase-3 subunit alpha